MINIVVPLFDVKLGSILFPLEINLLQVEEVLIVLHIYLFNFLLKHLLLVVLYHFVPLLLHLCQLLRQLRLLLGVTLDIFLQLCDLAFNLYIHLCSLLVFILRDEQLLAEEFEGQVLIAHVELVYFFLNRYFSLEFEVHIDLHRF